MNFTTAKIRIGLVTVLASLLLCFGVAAAQQDNVPPGYALVAENENLELYLDQDLAQLLVRHRETGHIWRTNPDLSGMQLSVGRLWERHMQSQFIIEYSDDDRRHVRITNNVDQEALVAYEPIRDGVRIVFTLQALGFQIPINYTLGEDYLEVKIVDEDMLETGDFMLVSIQLTPFFGAAPNTSEGYLVIPDGSGAVAYFKRDHPRYSQQFEEMVYGRDGYTFRDQLTVPWWSDNREVGMPIFGLVEGDKAFLGIITEGEYDARIIAAPSGYVVNLYRTGAEFTIRKAYSAYLARDRQVPTLESRRIAGDRAVRYFLHTGEDAHYVGLANTYRRYLQEKYQIAGRLHMKDDTPPLHLRIFNSVLKRGLVIDELIVMTSFEEAREIVETLVAAGVDHMDITLVGWTKDGHEGILPRRFPAERGLGGDSGLREFVQWANSQGFDVFLEDNFVNARQRNGGFNARHDVVRSPSRLPINFADNYLISPFVAYERFARNDIPEMARRYGVNGLDLTRFGRQLFLDRNFNYLSEREDTAFWWLHIAALAQQELGRVAIQGSNAYLLAVADKVLDVPMDPSNLLFVDHSIPFYQIVVSGLVPYSGYPSNLRNDPRREFLKMVEYGALPQFELTYRDSALLKDTRYNALFTSHYETWLDEVVYEFNVANKEMGWLKTMAITDHRQLAENVFVTGYEDGTRVYVNYRETPFVTDTGVEIGPLDYTLIRGGEEN